MGQLKTGIQNLDKERLAMVPKIKEMETQSGQFTDRVHSQARMIDEGCNVLVMYLMEKLKKENKTFETEGKKTLKEEMDTSVAQFGKGIVQAKADVKKTISTLGSRQQLAASELLKSVSEANATLGKLKAAAEKKKAKWFKSAKYKTKIAGYMQALSIIENALKLQAQSLTELSTLSVNSEWVDRSFPFNQDMTLEQVRKLTTMGFESNLQTFNERAGQVQVRQKKFRDEYKSMEGQFAVMKKWIDDADGMESESEEK